MEQAYGIIVMTDGSEIDLCGESLKRIDPESIQGFADGYETFRVRVGDTDAIFHDVEELRRYMRQAA